MEDRSKAGKSDGESQSASWTVCPCNNCSGNLEFDSAHAGGTVKCPHCGVETVLFIPQVPLGSSPQTKELAQTPDPTRPEPTARPSTAPASAQGNAATKNVLAVLLTIAGLTMLVVGYTAPARVRAEVAVMREAKTSEALWEASLQGTNDAIKAAEEYADALKRIAEGKSRTPQEELALSIGKAIEDAQKAILKGQKDSLDHLTDFLKENSSETRGAIQCCTGWLLIVAACIVFALGKTGKRVQP